LIQNYNIYGTAQPYYPDFVAGYGLIKEVKTSLNPERTINYYGFDITSSIIAKNTIYTESINHNKENNDKILNNILKKSSIRFFSIENNNEEIFEENEKIKLLNFFNNLFKEKSSYEI